MYKRYFKIWLDLLGACMGLILLSPVLLFLLLLLSIEHKGYPFFCQERPGKDAKIFRMIKFRTMNNRKDKEGNLLPGEERITGIGKILRKTSLDELPQLINILKGEMSLIGPRPLLVEYLPLYDASQMRRHEVLPGITGWAQVNGRNTISWQQKFDYDVWYVDHLSFVLDLKILWMTPSRVVRSEGVNASQEVTMEKFTGNNDNAVG